MSFLSSFLGGAGGAVIGNLVVSIVADTTGLKAGFDDAKQSAKGFTDAILSGKGLKNALGAISPAAVAGVAVAGIAAVGAVMVDSTAKAVKFQEGMANVMTLLPGAGQEIEDELTSVIRDLQTELGITSEKSLPAMYQAISAGVPQNNVGEFLETAAKAAVGGSIDLELAVDGLTSVVNAYGSDVIDVATASDVLFTTVRLGKTDMQELSSSLSQVTPLAAAAGVGIDQVGAAIATLTAGGTQTSVATTQLRQMFSELGKDTTVVAQAFKTVSGQSFPEFIKSGKTVEDALSLLNDYADEAGTTINNLFGSVEAGSAALVLTGSGADMFSSSLEQMAESAGATEDAFQTMDNTVSRRMEKIGVKIDSFMERIGEKILPVVEETILPAIESVMDFLDLLFGKIDDGTAQSVISFHPLFGVFETLKQWWEENGETVIAGCAVVWDAIVALWTQIEPYVTAAMDVLNTIIDTGLGTILDIITLVFALIAGDNEKAGELIYSINLRILNNLGTLIENGINTILEFIETSLNNLLTFATKIANSLIDIVENALNTAVDWANGFIDTWNELATLTGLPTIGFRFAEAKLPDLEAPEIELPRVTMISDKINELQEQYERLFAEQRKSSGETVTDITDNSVTNTRINLTQNITTNTPEDAWIQAGKEMTLTSLGGGGRG
ncbi:MAG TPA: phage tail tape measure protein [Methanocorpusculum sp.]|nr:phage tail tape measure protein [Methanocorpusculum sp.]HJK57185.1 phage tail tape measure protein [Methanocorpusculum sp.]HJK59825.1 phage tail tape measure protein [Methanocorpusculum sp.]